MEGKKKFPPEQHKTLSVLSLCLVKFSMLLCFFFSFRKSGRQLLVSECQTLPGYVHTAIEYESSCVWLHSHTVRLFTGVRTASYHRTHASKFSGHILCKPLLRELDWTTVRINLYPLHTSISRVWSLF